MIDHERQTREDDGCRSHRDDQQDHAERAVLWLWDLGLGLCVHLGHRQPVANTRTVSSVVTARRNG